MTSTEIALREKTEEVVATLNLPAVVEQIRESLPENVPLDRFKRVAITAIRANGELVEADQTSLFASLIRCAQDGLYPDNREAALVIFKGKVSYLPMVAGLRKIAAEHGWTIRTAVAYENDAFEYELGLEPKLVHHPARPGVERGAMQYAYAIGVHRSGRQEFEVMTAPEVEKVRQVSRAKDKGPWVDWAERMWEKTAAKRLFSKLALDPNDARLARVLEEAQLAPAEAAELLYGPDGGAFTSTELPVGAGSPTDTASTDATAGHGGGDQQAGAAVTPSAAPAPGDDDDPEPVPAAVQELAAAAQVVADTKIPNGANIGKTLAELAGEGADGEQWLGWALRNSGKFDDAFYAALETFVQGALPALWAEHEGRAAA